MRELNLISAGRLEWINRPEPTLQAPTDAIVRPIVVSRCDGDTLPIHRHVTRAMQAGLKTRIIDPAVGHICGAAPFAGPFAIGHECIAEVVALGDAVTTLMIGDRVVVPWSISCGDCEPCRRGLTSKCGTTTHDRLLAAYGFGPSCGPYGGMVSDLLRVPFARHMLVPLPAGLNPLRVAAASDNLADAWRTVVPHLRERPDARVLVIGGGAQSIGLYAAGLAVAHHAARVDYLDSSRRRRAIAETLGADTAERPRHPQSRYDIVVEASSSAKGLRFAVRSTAPGGICTAVGYYVATNTPVPLMHMYATDITLHLGVSHPRAILPELLAWVHDHDFPAERVTTTLAEFDAAPAAYAKRTTKLVLHRPATTTPANNARRAHLH
jgi:threonine dehydrogenase-like Zn-dependent dehydrogenase